MGIEDPYEIGQHLLQDNTVSGVAESKVMDLLEFGRIIHAEMSAICDALRKGVSVEGGTLYCTTFPCHLCAKHIVASGITKVVYLEVYPKSYASELHNDSIDVDVRNPSNKVVFEAFIGFSPFRYRDLFEKGRRKYSGGIAQKWKRGNKHPMIEVYFPSYFEAETRVVDLFLGRLEEIISAGNSSTKSKSTKRRSQRR
jgi:cytidine deaminase